MPQINSPPITELVLESAPFTLAGLTDKINQAIQKAGYPNRAEAFAAIESGALEYIEFPACVFVLGPNTNNLTFDPNDMPRFAGTFAGQPHLRNHDAYDIDSRDGTTQESHMDGNNMLQTVRLTTRRGMIDFVEGKIDRFSISWYPEKVLCTICGLTWMSKDCYHWPGREYDTPDGKKVCQLLSVNPKGKETSSVNAPAVKRGTGLLQQLEEMKLSIIGDDLAADPPEGDPMFKIPRPLFEADKGAGAAPAVATPSSAEEEAKTLVTQLREGLETSRIIVSDAQRNAAQLAILAESRQVLADQCSFLLTSGLSTSRLPDVVQTRLRKQFANSVFKLADLQAAIEDARTEVSTLTAGQVPNGPGRISNMLSGLDDFRTAFEDLMGADREPEMVGKRVHQLSGIREAYLRGTGDVFFTGGFDPLADIFSLGGTATFPGIVKDTLNKMLIKAWAKYGKEGYAWWQDIATVEHFDTLNTPDWVRTGTIGSLPVVAENGDYNELPVGDNVETSAWYKYGGYIELTLEAILRDNLGAFKKMPNEVALGAWRNISEQIAAIFTTGSDAGPTMADGGALFNATAVTGSGGHANLLTTAIGTTYTAWEAVAAAMFNQPMLIASATYGTGKKQAIDPKFFLGPRALRGAANNLFVSRSQFTSINADWYGVVKPLTVPEWTDADNWAAACDPNILPGIMIGEMFGLMPMIYIAGKESDGAMFANDATRIKVRQFLNVGVADWRALHKSNV